MKDKQLKDKAISIKGKDYVQVKDRVAYFNETYPNGSIVTKFVSNGEAIVVSAKVTPDCSKPERYFTGISGSNPAKPIEKTSPYEVAETSAVGRAMAMMGIGIIDSIASADEMVKAGAQVTTQTVHCKEHNIDVPILKSKIGNWYARCPQGHYVSLEPVDSIPSDIDRGDEPVREQETIF
jgi:hypothetical protein